MRVKPLTARIGGDHSYPTYATVPIDGELKLMVLYNERGVGNMQDLFMVPADGTMPPVNITETEDIWERMPSMSADGTFIIANGRDLNVDPQITHIYKFDFNAVTKKATNPTNISMGTAVDDYIQYLAMAKGDGDNRLAIVKGRDLYIWDLEDNLGPQQLTTGGIVYSASFLPDGDGFVVSTTERETKIYIVGDDGSFLDLVTTESKRTSLAYPDYREIF